MTSLRVVSFVVIYLVGRCFASADIVYLKSGRTIEGTILESNNESVVIEMAMGSVTYPRSKILRIERDREGNDRRNEIQKETEFEAPIADLKRSLSSLFSEKGKLSVLRLRVKEEESDVEKIENELVNLHKTRAHAIQELEPYMQYRGKRVPTRIYDQYTAAQSKYDTANAKVNARDQELITERRELADARNRLSEAQQKVSSALQTIRQQRDSLIDAGCPESALESINKGIESFGEFQLARQIPLRREGNSFFITVKLNGNVTEEFILDTGCSTILLTPAVANRLHLRPQSVVGSGSSTIADGSSIEVQNLFLDSVEVSGMKATHVPAQITMVSNDNAPLLLGMSFLERFRFSLDAQRGILTLE